jgi:predicted CoA-binding protein
MLETPRPILEFLRGKRIAVAGVSRSPDQAANAVFRKLRDSGYDAVPINPNASEVEGARCYPDLRSIPGQIDGLVIAAHPAVAVDLVRQCEERGVSRVWFHRSFGEGSVSDAAVRECEAHGIESIVGGCPLMFCQPVDVAHRCMRWWLLHRGRIGEGGHLSQGMAGGRL